MREFYRSEGAAEGGRGGNSAAPERSAGAKRRRSDFPSKCVRAMFRISHTNQFLSMETLNAKELNNLLYRSLSKNKIYLEALSIVKKNSSGKVWLIGSGVYKTLLNVLYGHTYDIKDWDFIVEKIKSTLNLENNWKVGETKGGNPKLKKNDFVIDLISLDNIHSIQTRNLSPSIANYLTGTPLTIQSLAFDVDENLILGEVGIKSILTRTISVNNASENNYAKGAYGDTYSTKRYADTLRLKEI